MIIVNRINYLKSRGQFSSYVSSRQGLFFTKKRYFKKNATQHIKL